MSRSFSSTVAAGKGVLPRSSMGARSMPAGALTVGQQFGNAIAANKPDPGRPQDAQHCYAAGGSWEQDLNGRGEFTCILPTDSPVRNPPDPRRFPTVGTGDVRAIPPSMNGDSSTTRSGTSDRTGPAPGTGDTGGMPMPRMAMPAPVMTASPTPTMTASPTPMSAPTMTASPTPMTQPRPMYPDASGQHFPTPVVPIPTSKVNPFCPPKWLTSPPQSAVQTPDWRQGSTWSGNSYQSQYSNVPAAPVAFYSTQRPCVLPSGYARPAGAAVLIQNSSLSPLLNGLAFVAAAAATYTLGKKVFE